MKLLVLKMLSLVILFLSLVFACSPGKKDPPKLASPVKKVDMQPKPTSPQTAKVSAGILSVEEIDGRFICTLKILKVHAYGSATPALFTGTKIKAMLDRELEESVAAGSAANLTLRFMKSSRLGSQRAGEWIIARIE